METRSKALELSGREWRSFRSVRLWSRPTLDAVESLRTELVEPWGLSKRMYSMKTVDEEIIPSVNVCLHLTHSSFPCLDGWDLLEASMRMENITTYVCIVGNLKSKQKTLESMLEIRPQSSSHLTFTQRMTDHLTCHPRRRSTWRAYDRRREWSETS